MTFGNTKPPTSFVVTGASFVPRASLMRTTVAPGTTPPCASFTVPVTLPVVIWAETGMAATSSSISAAKILAHTLSSHTTSGKGAVKPVGHFEKRQCRDHSSIVSKPRGFTMPSSGLSTKRRTGARSMQKCRFS